MSADQAREDFEVARNTAKQFAPDFNLPSNCLLHFKIILWILVMNKIIGPTLIWLAT